MYIRQLLAKAALIRVGATFIECWVSKICERQSATALCVAALHEECCRYYSVQRLGQIPLSCSTLT